MGGPTRLKVCLSKEHVCCPSERSRDIFHTNSWVQSASATLCTFFNIFQMATCGIALWLSCSALHASAGSGRQLGKSCLPLALHSPLISVSIAPRPPCCLFIVLVFGEIKI